MNFKIRKIKKTEYGFLEEMLYLAIYIPPGYPPLPKSVINDPSIRKYIENWGQKDDICLLAVHGDEPLGAVWSRKFVLTKKGYGYISDDIPEISMAVLPGFRNQGIGTALLQRMFTQAEKKGYQQLSLSVDQKNPALHLYLREGFTIHSMVETAFTMIKNLNR